jgi:hypothetical protein
VSMASCIAIAPMARKVPSLDADGEVGKSPRVVGIRRGSVAAARACRSGSVGGPSRSDERVTDQSDPTKGPRDDPRPFCPLLAQLDALMGADPGSVFAELTRAGLQALIDVEATQALGAGRYERTAERTDYRNGTQSKTVATTSGDVEVQIPKLRSWLVVSESA